MFAVNVEAAIVRDGKWFVIQRSSKEAHAGGTLSLVGGTVEHEGNQEDILERSLRREVFEEVGLHLSDDLHYVHSTSFLADDGDSVVNIVFLSANATGDAYCKSPDEVDGVYWMTLDEVLAHPNALEWTKDSIKRSATLLYRLQELHGR